MSSGKNEWGFFPLQGREAPIFLVGAALNRGLFHRSLQRRGVQVAFQKIRRRQIVLAQA